MSDIAPLRATVAVSAAAANGAGGAPSASPLATVAGGAIPPALAQLGIGAVVTGIVAERGPRGQIVIRTDKGSLTLQTPLAPRIGASITVQIQSLGAQSQLMILSVDGQPLSGQQAVSAKQTSALNMSGTTVAAKSATPSDGTIKPVTSPPLNPAAPPALRTGTVLTGVLTPQAVPPQTGSPSPVSANSPGSQSALRPAVVASPQGEDEPVTVRILGIAAPPVRPHGASSAQDLPPRAIAEMPFAEDAVTFTATVIDDGKGDAAHSTLLRTPFGPMRLPVPAGEPVGSQIALELLPRSDAAPSRMAPLSHELGAPRQILALGQDWPALRNVMTALEADASQIAEQTLATAVPRVGPALAAGMLLFVAAMRNGNLRNWLGDRAVETLERGGHGGLVKQLSDDMASLPRLAEAQPNGWQTLLLPVYDGEALRQIRMSLRRSRKDESGDRKDGARFIVEADLSKLGPLQLDGLVRLPQFDLAVRTRDNLPPELRANISEIFNDALLATGLKGAVVFQVARDLRPGPFENWQASGHGVTV